MIQQSVNVQAPPPRLHPKKRKFDLSELEDDHHQNTGSLPPPPTSSFSTSNVTTTAVHSVPSPVIISSNPTTSSTTVVYQKFPSEFASNNQNGNQHFLTSGGSNYSSPHVVTQVVKNTAEVQQIIKRQSYSYR